MDAALSCTLIANDGDELSEMIRDIVAKEGPHCDLNCIDVSRVTSMQELFQDIPFEGNLSRWDVSGVTNFWGMFFNSPFNGNISRWNTKNAIDMGNMFNASAFAGDISAWDTSSVESFAQMFHNNKEFQGDVSCWNVSRALEFDHMFYNSNWRGDLSQWITNKECTAVGIVSPYLMKSLSRPSVFHWKLFLGKPDQHSPESTLAPEWLLHFNRVHGIIDSLSSSLNLSLHEEAQVYQDSWLQAHLHGDDCDVLVLPNLDV